MYVLGVSTVVLHHDAHIESVVDLRTSGDRRRFATDEHTASVCNKRFIMVSTDLDLQVSCKRRGHSSRRWVVYDHFARSVLLANLFDCLIADIQDKRVDWDSPVNTALLEMAFLSASGVDHHAGRYLIQMASKSIECFAEMCERFAWQYHLP